MREADESLIEILENLDDEKAVEIWNEYCDDIKYYDDRIYGMWELDDLFCGASAHDLLQALDDDFDIRQDWFRETIYGLESFDNPYEHIDVEDMAVWVAEMEKDFGVDELTEYFEAHEEEDDEEEGGDEDEE